jgi:hypothetical protein
MVNSGFVHDDHHAIAILVQFTCFQGDILEIIQVLFIFVCIFIITAAAVPDRFQLTRPLSEHGFPP